MKIPANGFTHAGKFHADDVFATALLQILRPDIKITRGFTVPDVTLTHSSVRSRHSCTSSSMYW